MLVFNEEDFRVFVEQQNGIHDKLYVEEIQQPAPVPVPQQEPKAFQLIPPVKKVSQNRAIHTNVNCDGCLMIIVGVRFKCLQCDNFDLCERCVFTGTHDDHVMMRLGNPAEVSHSYFNLSFSFD